MPGAVRVHLGVNAVIDPGVLLGYPSGRPGISGDTRIGAAARIRSGSIVYAAVEIGEDFETGHHAIVREENRIGSHCTLWNNSTIDYGCVIGDRVKIHCNVYVAQFTTIEDDVFLRAGRDDRQRSAPDLHRSACRVRRFGGGPHRRQRDAPAAHHDRRERAGRRRQRRRPSDVPAGMLVAGNPARVIGPVDSVECPFGIVIPYEDGHRRPAAP